MFYSIGPLVHFEFGCRLFRLKVKIHPWQSCFSSAIHRSITNLSQRSTGSKKRIFLLKSKVTVAVLSIIRLKKTSVVFYTGCCSPDAQRTRWSDRTTLGNSGPSQCDCSGGDWRLRYTKRETTSNETLTLPRSFSRPLHCCAHKKILLAANPIQHWRGWEGRLRT